MKTLLKNHFSLDLINENMAVDRITNDFGRWEQLEWMHGDGGGGMVVKTLIECVLFIEDGDKMSMRTIYRDYYLLAMGGEFNNHELLKMSKNFSNQYKFIYIICLRINSVFNYVYQCFKGWQLVYANLFNFEEKVQWNTSVI